MAKYTVRTKEGELVYGSFGEVEKAWLSGLIEPDDEIREEGQTSWRKAGAIPILRNAQRSEQQIFGGTQMALIVVVVVLASFALYQLSRERYLLGGLVALVVAFLLFRVTTFAYKRRKPYG